MLQIIHARIFLQRANGIFVFRGLIHELVLECGPRMKGLASAPNGKRVNCRWSGQPSLRFLNRGEHYFCRKNGRGHISVAPRHANKKKKCGNVCAIYIITYINGCIRLTYSVVIYIPSWHSIFTNLNKSLAVLNIKL